MSEHVPPPDDPRVLHLQEALVEAERLAALGRMAAGIAHEINNALNVLQGNLQQLPRYLDAYQSTLAAYRDGIPARDRPDFAELEKRLRIEHADRDLPKMLAAMNQASERATAILRDLTIFSRGGDPDEMLPTDLRQPLEIAITLAGSRLHGKCTLRIAGEGDLPAVVVNAGRISQVLLNLLLNAADASSSAGEIRVLFAQTGDTVTVVVSDDGDGITDDQRSHLFEPFFTTKPPGRGTGLGLFVSRRIVEEHGGTLECLPSAGRGERGTAFQIVLPVNRGRRS
jgi:signal transduction histidine kinase